MRGTEDRARLLDEETLQPLQRGDVEVICGFVEEEEVRVVEEEPREAQARPLATGKGPHLASAKRVESEPSEDATERRLEVIASGVLEVMLRIGVSLEQRGIA